MLENSDFDASEILGEILGDVRGSAVSAELMCVLKNVDEFDFDAALENLKKLKYDEGPSTEALNLLNIHKFLS